MGFGLALGVTSSVIGGMMGDKAGKDASKQVAKANALTQKQIKEQQTQNNKAFSSYSDLGIGSNQKLAYLLGIGSKTDKYTADDFAKYNRDYAPSWYSAEGPQGVDTDLQYDDYLKAIAEGRDPNLGPDRLYQNDDLTKYGFRTLNDYSGQEFGGLLDKFRQEDLDSDVVYNTGLQFGLDEGNKALNRRASAYGGYDSGATLKALTRYANDYGTTKAEGAYNRFMDDKNTTYGFLTGQQGIGLSATGQNQSLNTGLVTAGANANMNAAGQQAEYGMMGANALSNGIQGGIGNFLYGQRLNQGVVGTYGGGGGGAGYTGGINLSGYDVPWFKGA
jgi:hypothetical protein